MDSMEENNQEVTELKNQNCESTTPVNGDAVLEMSAKEVSELQDKAGYKIKLQVFEGPLDLLLYLIKKNELNIYDIPIFEITKQYLEYLEIMELLDLNIAGEFIVMAATLMHIKSKMLLPPDENQEEEEQQDPRAELVRRLLEYKKYKEVAESLHEMEIKQKDVFASKLKPDMEESKEVYFEASVFDLITAFSKVLKQVPRDKFYEILKDEFTVEEKMHEIFHALKNTPQIYLTALFSKSKNKLEAITIFLAILELIRLREIKIMQKHEFGEIEIFKNEEIMNPVLNREALPNEQ